MQVPELLDVDDDNPPKTRVVRIATYDHDRTPPEGWNEVEAAVVPSLPDWLAITKPLSPRRTVAGRMLPTEWRVTHVPSGLSVFQELRKSDAILAAHALAREVPELEHIEEQITDWGHGGQYATTRGTVVTLRDLLREKAEILSERKVSDIVRLMRHGLLSRKELMKLPAATQVAIDDALEQLDEALERDVEQLVELLHPTGPIGRPTPNPPRGGSRRRPDIWAVEASLRAAGLERIGGGTKNTYYGLPGQSVGVGYFIKLSPKKLQYVLRVRGQYGKKLEDIKREALFYGHIRPAAVYNADGSISDELGQTVRADLEAHAGGTQSHQTFDKQAQALLKEWRERQRVWDGSELEDLAVHFKAAKEGQYGVQETFDKALQLAAKGRLDPGDWQTRFAVERVLEDMVRS